MKTSLCIFLLLFVSGINAQKPADGIYTYKITFAEWQDKSLGATCTIIIKKDSITVVHDSNEALSGKKGDIIEKGIIMKHKSGKWIIGHNAKDKEATEIGGCSDGPTEIDFKRKILKLC